MKKTYDATKDSKIWKILFNLQISFISSFQPEVL